MRAAEVQKLLPSIEIVRDQAPGAISDRLPPRPRRTHVECQEMNSIRRFLASAMRERSWAKKSQRTFAERRLVSEFRLPRYLASNIFAKVSLFPFVNLCHGLICARRQGFLVANRGNPRLDRAAIGRKLGVEFVVFGVGSCAIASLARC